MRSTLTALILGDIIGQSGSRAVFTHLKQIVRAVGADLTVVNGENATEGFGLNPELLASFFEAGADVVTTGNHIWQQKEILPLLDSEPRVLRPANYPPGVPGHGVCNVDVRGTTVSVMNLQGRRRLASTDCPFRKARELLKGLRGKTSAIIVDFHAEATEEKEAFGWYLDGDVAAVVGTHTHVPTNDARILPKGSAYQTDLGSCGPTGSVIGFQPEISIRRALTQLPLRNEVCDTPALLNGVVLRIDLSTGLADSIERYTFQSTI